MYISSSVFVCLFVRIFLSLFGLVVTNCTCIGTSLDPGFSLSFSLYLSQCPGILSVICMYVNQRDQLAAQRVIALKKNHVSFLSLRVYVRLLIRIFSFSFAVNVCTSFQIHFDSLYVHTRLWVVFVSLFLLEYL